MNLDGVSEIPPRIVTMQNYTSMLRPTMTPVKRFME
jgi:hypothetical protein